jgi:hypothetical protein
LQLTQQLNDSYAVRTANGQYNNLNAVTVLIIDFNFVLVFLHLVVVGDFADIPEDADSVYH